jgi:hypothetical protein
MHIMQGAMVRTNPQSKHLHCDISVSSDCSSALTAGTLCMQPDHLSCCCCFTLVRQCHTWCCVGGLDHLLLLCC